MRRISRRHGAARLAVLAMLVAAAGCDVVLGFRLGEGRDAGEADRDGGAPGDGGSGGDAALDDAGPPVVDAPPDGPRPVVGCPDSYGANANGQGKYRLVTTLATFAAAAADCADDRLDDVNHTHLVVLGDDLERSHVGAMTGGVPWIGLTDRVLEDSFEWVTDEGPAYPPASGSPWASGEPSRGTGEDCVSLQPSDDLEDGSCTVTRIYICECDGHPYDPTN